MSGLWRRAGYLAATAAAMVAVALVGRSIEPDQGPAVAVGVATAWLLQAPSFWHLAGRLARGERAVRSWIGGIAARFGGLAVLAVAGDAAGGPREVVLLAYGVAVLLQLMLEALWLWKRQPGRS